MAGGFPTFAPGMKERDQSASKMNRLSKAGEKADNFKVGSGANLRRGAAGNIVSVEPTPTSHILSTTRFVAVVVAPTKVDTTVMVRDVVYAIENPDPIDIDPVEDDDVVDLVKGDYTYRWGSSSRITATPGCGYVPMDFAGGVFKDLSPEGGTILPTADTPIYWLQLRGQGPPLLWPMNAKLTRQFKIIEHGIHDNYLRTHAWAGSDDTEGEAIVSVARPWLLRINPEEYSRNGITYTHIPGLPQERWARLKEDDVVVAEERQVIVPRYRVGDIIYATTGIAGGLDGAWGPNLPFAWLDDNRDSRAWAEKNAAHV